MFRFTIRDLLWLTLLAAFAAAWHVDRKRLVDERESIQKQLVVRTEEWEASRRQLLVQTALQQIERKWQADEELKSRMRAERLDDSTLRYLQAVRDPKNGFHYPVILRGRDESLSRPAKKMSRRGESSWEPR